MILLISTYERVGVFCGTECSSSVSFFLKAAEDVFSFQSESLPEVFVTVESEKNFKIILFLLEGVWKPTEMMMDNLRSDKMNVSISM